MSTIWELDFGSRPMVDDQGKRVWELLVCELDGSFRRSVYCNNQSVNSRWVADQLVEILKEAPSQPSLVRAFRVPLAPLLTRACELTGIPFRLSRRVYTLHTWMKQRFEEVYPQESMYTFKSDPSVAQPRDVLDPSPLPDALEGERWALVTLRVQDLQDAANWPMEFGELIPLDWSKLDPMAVVPGLLIASRRASPLAAWMGGIEPYAVVVGVGEEPGSAPELILETGASDRYSIARLTDDKSRLEGEGFEARKKEVQGLHFMAVQTRLDAQSFAGFWMLKTLDF